MDGDNDEIGEPELGSQFSSNSFALSSSSSSSSSSSFDAEASTISMSQVAVVALRQYRAKQYNSCLESLQKIQEVLGMDDDPKLLHNIGLVRYYAGGCREPQKFLELLTKLESSKPTQRRRQKAATTATVRMEEENEHVDSENELVEEVSILQYNQAVIHFQLKQYSLSTGLLERLFSRIEAIDETLGMHICFLLLDTYCILGQSEKTGSVVSILEKMVSPISSASSSSEFKPLVHLYKARIHVLNKSMKAAKREIKFAMGGGQSPSAILLKSNLEFLRNNFSKATKLLNAVQKNNSNDRTLPALYYNDMGCIHYRLKKYNAALFYFGKALKESETLMSSSSQMNLPTFARDKRAEIMYNNGLLLLLTGNPSTALHCFQEAATSYYKNPHLWLRMAECCVAIHLKKLQEEISTQKNDVVCAIIGSGDNRRVVLPTTHKSQCHSENVESSGRDKTPTGSLQYSTKCLRNVLYLCRAAEQSTSTSSTPTIVSHCQTEELPALVQSALVNLAYASLCLNDPVLALSSATELLGMQGLSQHFVFLGHVYASEALCMLARLSDAAKHLSTALLNTEASCGRDQNGIGGDGGGGGDGGASSPEALRASLLANLATVCILQEDVVQAQMVFNQALMSHPTALSTAPFILLAVYLSLWQGNSEAALSLLKRGHFAPKPFQATPNTSAVIATNTAGGVLDQLAK